MMARSAARRLAFLSATLPVLALGVLQAARADTPIALYQSFRGNVNVVGTEESLRSKDNSKPCKLVNSGSISASLAGIPSGATIKSAQLYWAGSGTTPDYTVTFDGVTVTAPAARQYVAKAYANNTVYTYFGGAADVTSQVAKKGNGKYSFSDLAVDNGNPWCGVQGVVGGFALAVVYAHTSEPFRMLNLYEGFQALQNTSVSIKLGNFNVPNPLPANVTGRIGHLTWEGDSTLSQGGEDLLFNGVEMTDAINSKGNQFNSASNVTGDTTSYGIDFDLYPLAAPLLQPGQSSATTTYRTGPDMVLLNAEIVALPHVATADLSLAMTRTGELTVGSSASYTLTVANAGADDEAGPVTVIDTIPAGLKLVSAGGSGWTCTSAQSGGQTIVGCTQPGPLAAGASLSALTIAVSPTAAGNYTNSATVYGKTADSNSANNSASNSGAAIDNGASAFAFTSRACTPGEDIVIAAGATGCPRFIGPVTAADTGTAIFITAVGAGQKATPMSSADYPLQLDLAASCLPYSGSASYAGAALDCKGSWQTVKARLPGGQPSAVLADGSLLAPFFYADVGRVSLSMRYNGTVADTVNLISRPLDIRFQSVFRADGTADYKGTAADGWLKDKRYGFTTAGAPFTMRVGALMANNQFAPSFGKEPAALKGVLPDAAIGLDLRLDRFLLDPAATPKMPVAGKDGVVSGAFAFDRAFALNTGVAGFGAMDATVRWYEAGNFAATPYLTDYLGTGMQVGGPPADSDVHPEHRIVNGTRVIGRFYPDHFETQVERGFACAASMACPAVSTDPAKPSFPVSGGAYSRQPFKVTVTPYGLARGTDPSPLSLFQNDAARPVVLSAARAPNDPAAPLVGTLSGAALPTSSAAADFPALVTAPSYSLGKPYDPSTSATRSAGDWGAPTAVYLRATMTETILVSGGADANPVITSRTAAGSWTPQYESGLLVVAGRLQVPNVFGSDLLRLPVPLTAQYWSGAAWLASAGDDGSTVAAAIVPVANGCRKYFAQDPRTGQCKANPLTIAGSVPVGLTMGKGTLVLQAPPRGSVGSVDFTLDNGASGNWLPSTQSRATFGLYRSPLIYVRELY